MHEKIGCWGWLGILLAIGLIYDYWYIIIPLTIIVYWIYLWRKKRATKDEAVATDSAANPTESLPEVSTIVEEQKPTVKDLFDETKAMSTMTLRLDEENKFYDFQDDHLNLNVLLTAYQDNPGQARQDIQDFVDSLCELSQVVYEKTGDLDYSFRQYIGQPDFDLLLVQVKNGQVEYFLLDDPQFLQLTNGDPDQPLLEVTPMDDDLATQLRQLKALFDEGVITRAEFEAKKKQLLGI